MMSAIRSIDLGLNRFEPSVYEGSVAKLIVPKETIPSQ